MDVLYVISWTATVSNICLLLTGIQTCSRIIRAGGTGQVAIFPFIACSLSGTLWTKYGLLKNDFPLTFVSAAGMVSQSIYIFIYYVNSRDKRGVSIKLLWAFLVVTSVLSYIKYLVKDTETAVLHIGFIASVSTAVVYGSPLVSLATVMRNKSTECLTFSLCLANFIVSLQWCIYGQLVHDNFIKFPNYLGVMFSCMQLALFICYPSLPQRTITYQPGSKPSKLEI